MKLIPLSWLPRQLKNSSASHPNHDNQLPFLEKFVKPNSTAILILKNNIPLPPSKGNTVDLRKNLMLFEYRISNKEPQNYEGVTSTFDIPCSTFCGSRKFA
jgi:hypothetical protein